MGTNDRRRWMSDSFDPFALPSAFEPFSGRALEPGRRTTRRPRIGTKSMEPAGGPGRATGRPGGGHGDEDGLAERLTLVEKAGGLCRRCVRGSKQWTRLSRTGSTIRRRASCWRSPIWSAGVAEAAARRRRQSGRSHRGRHGSPGSGGGMRAGTPDTSSGLRCLPGPIGRWACSRRVLTAFHGACRLSACSRPSSLRARRLAFLVCGALARIPAVRARGTASVEHARRSGVDIEVVRIFDANSGANGSFGIFVQIQGWWNRSRPGGGDGIGSGVAAGDEERESWATVCLAC